MLNLSHVSFAYPDCVVLRDFTEQLVPGVALVLGGDGRGKTSVQCLLAGELPPDAGRLQLGGVFLDEQPEAYRRQVFWMDPRSTAHDELAVDDYLAECEEKGQSPEKPASGKLVLRLPPELHGQAMVFAQGSGKSLNQWVNEVLQRALAAG